MLFEPGATTATYALRKIGHKDFNAVFFCDSLPYAKRLAQAYYDQHQKRLRIVKLKVTIEVEQEIT